MYIKSFFYLFMGLVFPLNIFASEVEKKVIAIVKVSKAKVQNAAALPTFAGYGSPVNMKTMDKTLTSDINGKESPFKFIGNSTNPNDWVGEGLGRNEGNKGESGYLDVGNLLNFGNLFINDNVGLKASPHSNYECNQLSGANCGDRP